MMNPTELDLKGKTAFFWAGTAALTTAWAWFRLPEVKVRPIFLCEIYCQCNIMLN